MTKISGLPSDTVITSDDYIAFVDNNGVVTKRMTVADFLSSYISPTYNTGHWWEELGRETLASSANTFTVTVAARRHLRVLFNTKITGATAVRMRFNGDSGANYADSYSIYDGNAYGFDLNSTYVPIYGIASGANDLIQANIDIHNFASWPKFVMSESHLAGPTAAASHVPEMIRSKWTNASTQITSITFYTSANNFAADTQAIVLGHD